MTDIYNELRRTVAVIQRKHGGDFDDLLQEAWIRAWQTDGPANHKIRQGNWRAKEMSTQDRRPFGHPGGQRSGANPPRSVIVYDVKLNDRSPQQDSYVLPGPLQQAVSTLTRREQEIVLDIALDRAPGKAAKRLNISTGYYRQERRRVLKYLRKEIENAR